MHGRRTDARALIAQILRTMKHQSNGFSAIDAGGRAIAHHAHGNLAHDVVRGLAPRGLKKTEDWYAVVWHVNRTVAGRRWAALGDQVP